MPTPTPFEFDKNGVCTNPERVSVKMPDAVVCHMLLAQIPDGKWVCGYAIAGREFPHRALAITDGGDVFESRVRALKEALCLAYDACSIMERFEHANAIRAASEKLHRETDPWLPNQYGFTFDGTGECTNAERIVIPCPEGNHCALLVAQMENGRWTYGCVFAGLDVPLFKYPCKLILEDEFAPPTRADALETAAAIVTESFEGDSSPIGKSVSDWAKALAEFATVTTEPTTTPTPPPAPIPTPPPEKPLEPVLPGMAHKWNEHGICTNPETVEVRMPKGAEVEILLGLHDDGKWRSGIHLAFGTGTADSLPSLNGAAFELREDALCAGLDVVRAEFAEREPKERARKAVANIDAFLLTLRPKDPAAQLAPATRQAPVYVVSFAMLPWSKIQRNPENHRKHFDPTKDRELAHSLLTEGQHQPIGVRRLLPGETPHGELALGDPLAPEFELIYGERRWRAAQIAKVATLEAKIYDGLTRKRGTAIALIENLQREDINCMEKAEGYAQLMTDETLTQEQCADRVGKERSTIANALRLLKLPARIRELLRDGKMTAAHGIALARFVPDGEAARAEFSSWETVVGIMAEEAVRTGATAGHLEKGVPSLHALQEAGLAIRIPAFGEFNIPAHCKRHAAYYGLSDGDFICFNLAHWKAELDAFEQLKKDKAEEDRKAAEAELARLATGGRKQISLQDLDRSAYREFDPAHAALLDLVPKDKKHAAKDGDRRTTVVSDVEFADRLKTAMQRAIKKNRLDSLASLEDKVLKKLAALKKVGPAEFAWLVYLIVDSRGRQVHLHLSEDAAKRAQCEADVVGAACQAKEFELSPEQQKTYVDRRLALLAKSDPVALVRTLIAERLPKALEEIASIGPDSTGARFVRWWLESDTLWLLEETTEGQAELVSAVKESKWFQSVIAGEKPSPEDES